MATKKGKINNYKIIYFMGLLFIVIIVAISLRQSKKQENNSQTQEENKEQIIHREKENIIAKLQTMEERERMEFYFGMFLNNIENGEYEKSYDLLYSKFKENYFPTLESFEEYVQKVFPQMAGIEYENIERNGDVYVLWIKIADILNGKPTDEKQQMNIVIQENDYNDFVLSFSII